MQPSCAIFSLYKLLNSNHKYWQPIFCASFNCCTYDKYSRVANWLHSDKTRPNRKCCTTAVSRWPFRGHIHGSMCTHHVGVWLAECYWSVMSTTIIAQSTGQYSLVNDSGDCNMLWANNRHTILSNGHSLAEDQVGLTSSANVVQLCYDSVYLGVHV